MRIEGCRGRAEGMRNREGLRIKFLQHLKMESVKLSRRKVHLVSVFQRSRIRSKNQEQEQAGSGAEASTGSQELLKSLLSGASV